MNEKIYTLRQSEDENETIDIFENAGEIILCRFIICEKGKTVGNSYTETLVISGGDKEFLQLIEDFFNKRIKELEEK
ncbi:MAG: hypothetical protein ACTSR2_04880 [Candidatus Hodarchaeales archaeon]